MLRIRLLQVSTTSLVLHFYLKIHSDLVCGVSCGMRNQLAIAITSGLGSFGVGSTLYHWLRLVCFVAEMHYQTHFICGGMANSSIFKLKNKITDVNISALLCFYQFFPRWLGVQIFRNPLFCEHFREVLIIVINSMRFL